MVAQKYRWDFIGLSTDTKPTSETSDKVVNGSTYYCSDTSKLYVYCNGTWYERKPLGGGGGGGGTSDFNDLSNRPKYNGSDMTGSTNIPEVKTYTAGSNVAISDQNVISATDTTYSAFTGTDGQTAGTAGLVPAPATTDAGKFLKADGTWDTAGGGSGDTVYSDKTTSNSSAGGAVYIGSLNTNQEELSDPTTTDNHYHYFWALPFDTSGNDNFGIPKDETINIGGQQLNGAMGDISIGYGSKVQSGNSVVIGDKAWGQGSGNNIVIGAGSAVYGGSGGIAIGRGAETSSTGSVALGAYARTSRVGELYIGTTRTAYGYNSTNYRVLGGVHDPVDAHDAATKGYVDPSTDSSAPTTATVGRLGQIYIDTTNADAYMCVAVDTVTPSYTWKKITA